MSETTPPATIEPRVPGWLQRAGFLLVVLAMAWFLTDLRFILNDEGSGSTFAMFLQGEAFRPAAYRALVPWLVTALFGLLNQLSTTPLDPQTTGATLFFYAELVSLVALFLSVEAMLSDYFPPRRYPTPWLAFSIFLIVPFNAILPQVQAYYYPYDTPALVFMALGLLTLRRKAWGSYYVVFLLATLNRETSVFLTGIYLFSVWGKEKPGRIAAHIGVQAAIWLGVRLLVSRVYAGNEGFPLLLATAWNLQQLVKPRELATILASNGFLWLPVLLGWPRIPDEFVRRALLIVPPFLLGMTVVGMLPETRIFYELTPLLLLAAWLLLHERFALAREA